MKSNYFATATSSLDLAMEMAASGGLEIWDSVLVGQQSAGRGQMRRQWFSPVGNLHAALRLPLLPPLDSTAAAPAVATLLAESLEAVLPSVLSEKVSERQKSGQADEEVWQVPVLPAGLAGREIATCPSLPGIQVKWPNDIVISDNGSPAKLAGILLEQKGDVLLAGIGINLVEAPPAQSLRLDHAMPATCLAEVLARQSGAGKPGCLLPEPRAMWPELAGRIRSLLTPVFCATWQARLEARLLWLGRQVMVSDGQSQASGRLLGIDPDGGLRIAPQGNLRLSWKSGLGLDQDNGSRLDANAAFGADAGRGEQVLFSGSLSLMA